MSVRVGDPFPDVELVDHEGRPWHIAAYRGRPLVLVLHRHLAWLPCQEHVIAVRDHLDQFGDATIAVVTFADPIRLTAYRTHLGLPFDVLTDPDRHLYRLFGAGRGTTRQVWSPGTLRLYGTLLRRGRRLRRPTEDIHQLGADAVIGRDGTLRYLTLPASPDARPPISELIGALD